MTNGGLMGEAQAVEVMAVNTHAVYRCYGVGDHLLYVGTTGNFGRRLAEHAQKIWFLEVRKITLEWYPGEVAAGCAERRAIFVEKPRYNIVYKNGPPARRRGFANSPAAREILQLMRSQREAQGERPYVPPVERKLLLAEALADASHPGIAPRDLVVTTGLGRTFIHYLLAVLVERDAIVRVNRGRYLAVPGRNIADAVMNIEPPNRDSR